MTAADMVRAITALVPLKRLAAAQIWSRQAERFCTESGEPYEDATRSNSARNPLNGATADLVT